MLDQSVKYFEKFGNVAMESILIEDSDIFDIVNIKNQKYCEEQESCNQAPLKFLILPSFMAGVFLGINNFFLGFISGLGINAATEFSIGALVFTLGYKIIEALKMKAEHGVYFPL